MFLSQLISCVPFFHEERRNCGDVHFGYICVQITVFPANKLFWLDSSFFCINETWYYRPVVPDINSEILKHRCHFPVHCVRISSIIRHRWLWKLITAPATKPKPSVVVTWLSYQTAGSPFLLHNHKLLERLKCSGSWVQWILSHSPVFSLHLLHYSRRSCSTILNGAA